jgi:hypothetical protein
VRRLVAALALVTALALSATAQRECAVGLTARIEELVLPGSELEAAPFDAHSPVVLRITAVRPHGTEFRYDLEWSGLEPGDHDLRAHLRRKDGTSAADLPPIPVTVRSSLPAGQVKPHPPAPGSVPRFGGYRALLVVAGILWTIGLILLVTLGRRRRAAAVEEAARPRTLAERLQPLVERAARGALSSRERAELEASLVAYWRRRLALEDRAPDEALRELRRHAEAGPLLQSLEDWLHRPEPSPDLDVAALLAPYRDLPPDALESARRG